MSLHIRRAAPADIPQIQTIARQTWPRTFGEILSADQIAYMLEWMYSTEALTGQMERLGHRFVLAAWEGRDVGYASFELDYRNTPVTKLHKLYVLPETQGTGVGRALLDVVRDEAFMVGQRRVTLNVNRHNPAIKFYERYGFQTVATEDIDIGNGYYMNDLVMELANETRTPMNETLRLLQTRRSVSARLLTDPAPRDAELTTLLTIAARVPDHGKAVPWRFIVIDRTSGVALGETIASLYAENHPEADTDRLAMERNRLTRAPLVIAVVSRPYEHPKATEWEQILSAGAVCMNLVIAANAMGYATNWLTEWYSYDQRFLAHLGMEANERVAGFIHIGTSTEQPGDRQRPELGEIVTPV